MPPGSGTQTCKEGAIVPVDDSGRPITAVCFEDYGSIKLIGIYDTKEVPHYMDRLGKGKRYRIEVEGYTLPEKVRRWLKAHGFVWDPANKVWVRWCSDPESCSIIVKLLLDKDALVFMEHRTGVIFDPFLVLIPEILKNF